MIAGMNNRISVLEEISIYTKTNDGSTPLKEVMQAIYKEFGDDPGIESNSDGEELKAFIKHILPEYDESRVYVSDIKKVVNWYGILLQEAPDLLKQKEEEGEGE